MFQTTNQSWIVQSVSLNFRAPIGPQKKYRPCLSGECDRCASSAGRVSISTCANVVHHTVMAQLRVKNGIINRTINGIIEGSLEVKLPTIWIDEKQSRAEAERRERSEEKRVEEKE